MPLVEKVMSETDLRDQITRLQQLIQRNPRTAVDQGVRLQAARDELNKLLLAKGGYSVTRDADVQAQVETARKDGYAAGHTAGHAVGQEAANAARDADVQAQIETARKEGYAAGHAVGQEAAKAAGEANK